MFERERLPVGIEDLSRRDAELTRGEACGNLWVGGGFDRGVDPEGDIDGLVGLRGCRLELPELVGRVHRDPDALLYGEGEVGGGLGTPVEEERSRAHARRKGERDLAGREDIGPGAHRRERPKDRQIAVRLCGVEYADLRVVGGERAGETAEVIADPHLIGDVERGAEPSGKVHRIVLADPEVAVPDREVGGKDHRSSPRIRSTASLIRSIDRVMANRTNPSPFLPNPSPGVATIPAASRSFAENAMQSSTGTQT